MDETGQLNLKKKAFIEAWIKTFGNKTQSCKIAGIARQTFYNWLENDKEFKATLEGEEVAEQYKDFIESKLVERANSKSDTMLIFLAKTKLKDRGYVEKTEIEHTGKVEHSIIKWKPATEKK